MLHVSTMTETLPNVHEHSLEEDGCYGILAGEYTILRGAFDFILNIHFGWNKCLVKKWLTISIIKIFWKWTNNQTLIKHAKFIGMRLGIHIHSKNLNPFHISGP